MKTPLSSATRYAAIILVGFGLVISVLMLITNLGLVGLGTVNQRLETLVKDNNVKMMLMHRMRDVIRERMLTVYNITQLQDPFEIEKEWERFSQYASVFIDARERLYALGVSDQQYSQLEGQKEVLAESYGILSDVIDLFRQNRKEDAHALLAAAVEKNTKVLDALMAMIESQQQLAQQSVADASLDYQSLRQQMLLLNVLAVALCLLIILVMVRRIVRQQGELDSALLQLKNSNERLEARVEERTAELLAARDEALEASRTKSRFLANMSHELRTPLNAIIGYAEILQEDLDEQVDEMIIDDLKRILAAARHLLDLINDVLDISKIETGKNIINPELFDLRKLIKEVVNVMFSLVEERQNRFILDCDDSIQEMYADKVRIRQVLFNLLSNANKFTENGEITLTARRYMVDDKPWISCQVRDTGIGISQEQQKRLFRPFVQLDNSSTRKYGGTGLGLVISLRFCQLMGGNISVESELGKGCIFTVSLPETISIEAVTLDSQTEEQLQCLQRGNANDCG